MPQVFMLASHGIFVHGNDVDSIREAYAHILNTLEQVYREAGVETGVAPGPAPSPDTVHHVHDRLKQWLGDAAEAIAPSGIFAVPKGPISPDHIVYALSYPYCGPLEEGGLRGYVETHGLAPRVVATAEGVFGIGPQQRTADRALEFARDGAEIEQLAAAFGGVLTLGVANRRFIEDWEVEAYRRTVSG